MKKRPVRVDVTSSKKPTGIGLGGEKNPPGRKNVSGKGGGGGGDQNLGKKKKVRRGVGEKNAACGGGPGSKREVRKERVIPKIRKCGWNDHWGTSISK